MSNLTLTYYTLHSTGFGPGLDGDVFIPNGKLTVHIRVTDADHNVSAARQDVISVEEDGPVTIFVARGSYGCVAATAGGESGPRSSRTGCNGEYMRHGPMREVAPDAGIFGVDIPVRYDDGPGDERCPARGCILLGDVILVEYLDQVDAYGDRTAKGRQEQSDQCKRDRHMIGPRRDRISNAPTMGCSAAGSPARVHVGRRCTAAVGHVCSEIEVRQRRRSGGKPAVHVNGRQAPAGAASCRTPQTPVFTPLRMIPVPKAGPEPCRTDSLIYDLKFLPRRNVREV